MMSATTSGHDDTAAALRARAELKAREVNVDGNDSALPEETRRLLHELQVHQIELEMQNDELRRSQEELHALQESFFDFYNLAPVGYVTLCDKGLILDANITVAPLLGVPRGDLPNQPLTRFILPEDQDVFYLYFKKVFALDVVQSCELRMKRGSDCQFWARIESAALRNLNGAPVCRIVLSDITERKEAERTLKASEAKYRRLHESMTDAFVSTNMSGDILETNKSYNTMLGYSAEELRRLTYKDITPENWHAIESRIVEEQIMTRGFSDVYEKEYRRKDGSVFPVELRTFLLTDDEDHPIGMWAIVRDITERKRIKAELVRAKEEAEAANKAKSEFLANMSHEIRTPLNAVIGFSDILKDTQVSDEQHQGLEIISRRGTDLVAIINDILDIAKIEAGRLDIAAIPFSLRLIVGEVVETFSAMAKIKSLDLDSRVDDNVPDPWKGDPLRIKQVLVNLLGNAFKFTYKGSVSLRVALDGVADAPPQGGGQPATLLRFTVTDTGIGIPADKLTLVFHPFTQADASHTRIYGGTGLGLTICERLCTLMGGRIWAESRQHEGSAFHFTLPLFAAKAPPPALPHRGAAGERGKSLGIRTLIIEDDPSSALLTQRYVDNFGGTATIASTGPEALALLEKRHDDFDLVLMDVRIPGTSGIVLTKATRMLECEKGLPRLMIVALTANARQEDRDACLAAGMDSHLPKPVDKDALYRVFSMAAARRPPAGN